jgi:branched-chain amino acid transport system permease protein
MKDLFKDALAAGFLALMLSLVLIGVHTKTVNAELVVDYRFDAVAVCVGFVFLGRFGMGLLSQKKYAASIVLGLLGMGLAAMASLLPLPSAFMAPVSRVVLGGGGFMLIGLSLYQRYGPTKTTTVKPNGENAFRHQQIIRAVAVMGIAFAILLPILFPQRAAIEMATLIFIYIMLGWGLNIVVGLAGLLDLGFVAFYAVGAYAYALLSLGMGFSFWQALPVAGLLGAGAGFILGLPVLRLRGDYFAIVTLGFGEIIRIVLINWQNVTGGPNGLSNIPRPSFFGVAEFTRTPKGDLPAFHTMFGLDFSPLHRIIFLYYLIVMLALIVNLVGLRLRRLPLGRAWEALREDDIACQALGINRRNIKLAAFMISACFGAFAGCFFAARQGFISPESFTFMESAVILAIVVLGGMGSQTGVVLATFFVVFLPEYFRDLELYRMLMFGLAMVVIMVYKPAGLLAHREPSVRLKPLKLIRGTA